MPDNKYDKIVKAIDAGETDNEKLDQMFWAAENGYEFPLVYYDEETWEGCVREGNPSASAVSNLGNAIRYIEAGDWEADIMTRKRHDGKVLAEISICHRFETFVAQSWTEGPSSLLSRMLVSSFCKVRPRIDAHFQHIISNVDKSAEIPKPSEWPIEMCEDGDYRAINREHGLALYGVSSSEDFVRNYAQHHEWDDFVMNLCAHRFAELVEEGVIAPDVTPEP